jgi:hypothetical protein
VSEFCNSKFKIQPPLPKKFKIQNSKFKIQNSKFKIQSLPSPKTSPAFTIVPAGKVTPGPTKACAQTQQSFAIVIGAVM